MRIMMKLLCVAILIFSAGYSFAREAYLEVFLVADCKNEIVYEDGQVIEGTEIYVCSNENGKFKVLDREKCEPGFSYQNPVVHGGPGMLTCDSDNLEELE